MTPLWTSSEAAAATGGKSNRDWSAHGVSIDSRSLNRGDLFVALKGPKFDGHDYLAEAFKKGAAAALVHRVVPGLPADAALLTVADTQAGIEALGRAARARMSGTVIGVTGSVGKTGTKEALRHALDRQGATIASQGSLNNQWGVPLSLSRMPRDTRYGVFEMGMNHAGEIDGLTRQVKPDIAIVTTIEPAHLGFFASVDAIADAKAEIFNGMSRHGTAILNRDNPHYERLAAAAAASSVTHIIGFGEHAEAQVRLIAAHLHGSASAVTVSAMGEIVDYCIALPGRHWVMNSLAVLAAAKAAGADIGAAAASLATLAPLAGRGERHTIALSGGDAVLIDESYNASPASMRAAFAVLGAIEPKDQGRRIAVLGDMLELGADSASLHAGLAQPLLDAKADLVFTVGKDMAALDAALPAKRRGGHADNAETMAEPLLKRLKPGDVVTIKGSYGSRMRVVVAALTSAKAPATAKD
ncbi:MAG TPA: UDP-N-acetylmuramoylalanyl-D-glutamyl-2,6-diaminopimelate--D-alanyl-D-alanine ligase [Stellaceae bacterium]|jgi:UDP-N-acetylmuramoyl-tripeptide--D-alanyl-D-alanine ligase|nr:UDP-N-acetylmuramoylalanyl-D-glutamyl-2,6-diaminopimelate--D-alanyl-D-alanine ligase [Stellaceae bacterium]